MSKNIIDILLMTPKTSVSIYISSIPPGSLFRPNADSRETMGHTWRPSQKSTVQEGQHQASLFMEQSSQKYMPQSGAFLPFASISPTLSQSQLRCKETVSTLGRLGSHPGLEASCITSASISCKSFIGIASRIPRGTYLTSHRTQRSPKLQLPPGNWVIFTIRNVA